MRRSEPIDEMTLKTLQQTTGGDPLFLAKLIDTYIEDSALQIAAMQQALAERRAEDLRRAAHTLKSNSINFGALPLARLCKELEDRSKAGALEGAEDLVEKVRAECRKVQGALLAARKAGQIP